MSTTPSFASGHGLATIAADGSILDTWFPQPRLGTLADNPAEAVLAELEQQTGSDSARGVEIVLVSVESNLQAPARDAHDVWLRLHALSARLVTPNSINLEGIFGFLTNVVWTNFGPCAVADFETTRTRLRSRGKVTVQGVDKFPAMLDYVVPAGVRIADATRVRLGAYLAEGTTVMHEGFINFNAGTLGASMVEGRISAGVVIGSGTDIGGGASIMGTLSGGGKEKITLGENVLLGANAGIGISLGDGCVVEAGLYVTASTKIAVLDAEGSYQRTVKGSELSGVADTLFIRHSESGRVEARPRTGASITLNAALHAQ